jgi:hypothetical protein
MDRALFEAVWHKSSAQWSHRTIVSNKSDHLLMPEARAQDPESRWPKSKLQAEDRSDARRLAETKIRELNDRKSPQKRPIWRRTGNARFARAGWAAFCA